LLALAWSVDANLWTNDRDFAGTGVASWSTPNLLRALGLAPKGPLHEGCRRRLCYRPSERERPMIVEISSHREELGELCRRFHVRRLDLFGSATGGDFDAERSDLDFLVEFDLRAPEALSFTTFFDLKEGLEALFGRKVDLVELSAIRNPYLKSSIEHSREPVFEA
jgi:uncharacterized protein